MGTRLKRDCEIQLTEEKTSSGDARLRDVMVRVEGTGASGATFTLARGLVLDIGEKLEEVVPEVTLHWHTAQLEMYWEAGPVLGPAGLAGKEVLAGGVKDTRVGEGEAVRAVERDEGASRLVLTDQPALGQGGDAWEDLDEVVFHVAGHVFSGTGPVRKILLTVCTGGDED